MRLYIVRHAIAAPHGTPGIPDDDGPLTEEGIKKMRQAAAGLRSLDYVPELILTSPLLRARQTAEILMEPLEKADRSGDASGSGPLRQPKGTVSGYRFLRKRSSRA